MLTGEMQFCSNGFFASRRHDDGGVVRKKDGEALLQGQIGASKNPSSARVIVPSSITSSVMGLRFSVLWFCF